MTYANITIGDLLNTYMYAVRLAEMEGFVCDGDKQQINAVFNEA